MTVRGRVLFEASVYIILSRTLDGYKLYKTDLGNSLLMTDTLSDWLDYAISFIYTQNNTLVCICVYTHAPLIICTYNVCIYRGAIFV